MKSASDFLSKFQKLTPPNDALRRAVSRAASEILGTPVAKDKVRVQNSVAYLDVSSVAKHKLRTERRALLDLIYEQLPKARDLVRDVR